MVRSIDYNEGGEPDLGYRSAKRRKEQKLKENSIIN